LQFWASTFVVLPVFVQAPWVHISPFSALFFTLLIISVALYLGTTFSAKWENLGALLLGVSGSWLGGCLFWGWLRASPIWHLPVESIALPFALIGINTRWRIGASFYLASLIGTAITDLMILSTGVMESWPEVVQASFKEAPQLLNATAQNLLLPRSIILVFLAGLVIVLISTWMGQRAKLSNSFSSSWLVASAALTTTLWVDGLFFITTLVQPQLSGLI
tara:strand:- start:2749 stop:3408 length:660 start_codon:yes stop_codon:yes gene_type:complete